MRKDTMIKTTVSRRTYVRPLITAVIPASVVLQEATPAPTVKVDDEPGEEALSKIYYDVWNQGDDDFSEKNVLYY